MAELVLNVHDTTGAVLNVIDGVAITHRVLRGPVEVTAGPGGGAVDSVNAQTGVVVLDAADVGAAAGNTAPAVVGIALATGAVDGTETSFDVIHPNPNATASGDIPAGWESVLNIPNLATMQGALSGSFPSGVKVLVPAGANAGVYFITADTVDEPWVETDLAIGATVIGPATWIANSASPWIGHKVSATLIEQLRADLVAKAGEGLDTGLTTVETILENHEGVLDTEHWVCAYFDTTVIDPTDYDTAPVTQPTPDGGIIVDDAHVLVLTAADTTKRGIWHVSAVDGTWSQVPYPDILIGNSFSVMVNAEGDADDGVHFEWIDEDPTIPKRRSFAYPGSSAGQADGRNGRWIKYTPGGGTVDALSNFASGRIAGRTTAGSGDSEELTAAEVRTLLNVAQQDAQTETLLFNSTRATPGEFDLSGVNLTDYDEIRWEWVGASDAAAASDSLRMTFTKTGGPTGNIYGMGTSANTTLFVLSSNIPGSLTNTDRRGKVTGTMSFVANAESAGDVRVTGKLSNASVGLAHSDNTLYFLGTTSGGVVTGIDIYLNTGQPVAGTRLRIWGRRRAT